jgi:NADH-quinone oxidoreductase subunit J
MHDALFWLCASLAVGGAALAMLRKEPLKCALSLVTSFVALAGLYFQLKSPFPAVLQILLYAGAIMVLIVFVIMFLNDESGAPGKGDLSRGGLVFAVLLLVPLGWVLIRAIWNADWPMMPVAPEDFGTVPAMGEKLFTTWLYPFEVLSLLLLAAMAGAVLLAKKRLD